MTLTGSLNKSLPILGTGTVPAVKFHFGQAFRVYESIPAGMFFNPAPAIKERVVKRRRREGIVDNDGPPPIRIKKAADFYDRSGKRKISFGFVASPPFLPFFGYNLRARSVVEPDRYLIEASVKPLFFPLRDVKSRIGLFNKYR